MEIRKAQRKQARLSLLSKALAALGKLYPHYYRH